MSKGRPFDVTDMNDPRYHPANDHTHPFYEPDKVGPGRPPKQYQWQKGCSSPWPKGRPKKQPTIAPDLKKAMEDGLNEKVAVTVANKKVLLTKATLGIKQLINQFANGDRHARRDLMDYCARLNIDLLAAHKATIAEAVEPENQAIIETYLQRRQSATAPESSRVRAPPELLDDDVAAPAAATVSKLPPSPRAPLIEPLKPDTRGRVDARANEAMRKHYLAEQKKNQGS